MNKYYTVRLLNNVIVTSLVTKFLPRCMECRRGLAMRIMSVRPFLRLFVC